MSARLLAALALLAACASAPRPRDGALISVDLAGEPMASALRTVATAAHVNIDAADPALAGTVTLRMRAPWKIVLARIAHDHDLRVVYQDRIVRVCAPTTPCDAPPAAGAPITAAFDDTPIRDAAAAFARVAKVDVVVDPDVQVDVTMHVRNAPWDLALDHLARKYGLVMSRTGSTVRISHAPAR